MSWDSWVAALGYNAWFWHCVYKNYCKEVTQVVNTLIGIKLLLLILVLPVITFELFCDEWKIVLYSFCRLSWGGNLIERKLWCVTTNINMNSVALPWVSLSFCFFVQSWYHVGGPIPVLCQYVTNLWIKKDACSD